MLTSLQTLPYFKVRNENGHRIGELGSLRNLKGKLRIDNLERVQGEEESARACLYQKPGIVKLVLMWERSREGEFNDENVLNGLQPHPNIKILHIVGFEGASFPMWTLKMAVRLEGRWIGLSSLAEIILSSCGEFEEIPMLGHLPHLKSLGLRNLKNVKCIGASFYGIGECSSSNGVYNETVSVFPSLERLQMVSMPRLREWEEVEIPSGAQVKVFPCLKYLDIRGCKELRSAPSQFTSLKELIIDGMESELPLASTCSIQLKTLKNLQIERIDGLICLPDWLFHNNQRLSMLTILSCPKLRKLPNGLNSLAYLEELNLEECDKLQLSVSGKKLQGLTSLRRLSISGRKVLTSFLGEMEDSWVSSLEELRIGAGNSDAWDCASFKKIVDGILQFESHSLLRLHLNGMQGWDSLPEQLQHLTALSKLTLSRFGIEELPEWFANFSSLRELEVYKCRKLKHLPSVEASRRLTNLTTLDIDECPLLKERCIEEDDEWIKVSHIPNIYVDNRLIRVGGRTLLPEEDN